MTTEPSATAYMPTGPFKELDILGLAQVVAHLHAYADSFLVDADTAMRYAAAIVRHKAWPQSPDAMAALGWCVGKALASAPLDVRVLDLACPLTRDPALAARRDLLEKMHADRTIWDLSGCLSSPAIRGKKRDIFMRRLERTPGNLLVANQLLSLDHLDGAAPDAWAAMVRPPEALRPLWTRRLFAHHAAMLRCGEAMALWPQVEAAGPSAHELNLAAECFRIQGDTARALACYRASLAMDASQRPVALRVAELERPGLADAALVHQKKVSICLYSWNKADMLARTLASLAATDIGPASVTVLLNGCTDNSRAVVDAARERFPGTPFEIIALPCNVGAPAARNWLIHRDATWDADYIAFLDDDVTLPPDWLAHLLTEAEARPNTAVVGCKILFEGAPPMIQYLYRRFTTLEPRVIKLSDPVPVALYDNGLYDVARDTVNVMGCCHLLRTAHLRAAPLFDLRFSPSQIDDIAHDVELRLAGYDVTYCGRVACVHHQASGASFASRVSDAQLGNILGNDIKFFYKFAGKLDALRAL
ncbi:MAG: glycosyltransferase [Desulfovibrionaceae bacterium]